jgi:3-isopropylmalate dehydrogenase
MYRVAVIRGDGIGPTIVEETLRALCFLSDAMGLSITFIDAPAGDGALKEYGSALPSESISAIEKADACLKGPVGESAKDVIVYLRRRLDLYSNLRPARTYEGVMSNYGDVDLLIVRENTEDVYRGVEDVGRDYAVALMPFSRFGTERIARVACKYASRRRRKITIVDKSNVIMAHRFFREVASSVIRSAGEFTLDYMYVDNAAYQLVVNPTQFDVILTTNMFGDILSDEAAGVCGTLGLAPSGNIGDRYGLFEPVHGSAPSIDPRYANPLAMMLSASMMLEWLGDARNDAKAKGSAVLLEQAVRNVLSRRAVITPDLGGGSTAHEVCDAIINELKRWT